MGKNSGGGRRNGGGGWQPGQAGEATKPAEGKGTTKREGKGGKGGGKGKGKGNAKGGREEIVVEKEQVLAATMLRAAS